MSGWAIWKFEKRRVTTICRWPDLPEVRWQDAQAAGIADRTRFAGCS
jgi:hypothetical protein